MKRFFPLYALLPALLLCLSCQKGEGTGGVASEDSLCILFTGDVLLDRGIRPMAEKQGVEWLFQEVESFFRRADATVINLECPLTDVATPLGKKYIFRADTRWASDLRSVGITHAALANNHTNDQGYQGFSSTLDCLRKADIVPLGHTRVGEQPVPAVLEKGGLRVALFNAVLFTLENWMPYDTASAIPCQTDARVLASAIRRYRHQHPSDRIVCVVHWGVEFQTAPSMKQRRQARLLAEAGADAIVGHHPHVVQSCRLEEICDDAGRVLHTVPVAYSLGNFVFDQHALEACRAEMARVVVTRDTLYMHMLPVRIVRGRPTPESHLSP